MAKSKVQAVRAFLDSSDTTLVCTHATFRFAVELGIEAFDNRLIAIDEFHTFPPTQIASWAAS